MRLPGYAYSKDFQGGLILVLIGAAVAYHSQVYRIGTLHRMGPGFFPASLGVILTLTGLAMVIITIYREPEETAVRLPPEWRGWICISLGLIAFAVLAKHTGLISATFTCVFVTALGDRGNSLRDATILATGITVAGVVVFRWGLQVLIPLVAWKFG